MSAKSFQQNSKQTICGVLPDIVANYQTLMCNPYSKTKPRNSQTSKIPVALSRANNNKPIKMQYRGNTTSTQVPRPVHVPVSTAKQSCSLVMAAALPKGMFGGQAKSELKKFKIPKLSRDNFSTSANASKEGLVKTKSQYLGKHQSRVQPLSTVTISKSSTVSNANKIRTEKSSRIPTVHVTKPKLNQSKHELHSNSTKPVARTETKSSSTINSAAQCNNYNSKRSDSNVKPWPYGIPPCSRYEIKWGDPAYTGSYVDGEWWYDIVGAAPKPMKWPDILDTFPDIPTGMFELRSAECIDTPSAKSAACEGKPVNWKEDIQTTIDDNAFQSAPRHSEQNNALFATEPSENVCLANRSKSTSLSSHSQYTTVQAVTQPTTIYDKARVTSCHSTGVANQFKPDICMESCMNLPCSKGNNPFVNVSSGVSCVTQPKPSCDQVRIASCHSAKISKQTKRDGPFKSAMKSLYSNGHKPFASVSPDLPSVNQPKTLYNPARIALCSHSGALAEQIKRDRQAVTKLHDTMGGESQPLKDNERKPFPSLSSDLVYKRGIKRAASNNSNMLLNKKLRMERQN